MDSLICPTCNMTFTSSHFLTKHKEKFCIGGAGYIEESPQNMSDRTRDLRRRRQQQKAQTLRRVEHKQQSFQREIQHHLQKPNSQPAASNLKDQAMKDIQLNRKRSDINLELQRLDVQDEKVAELERMLFELKTQEQRNTLLLESIIGHLEHKAMMDSKGLSHSQDILQNSNSYLHIPRGRERLRPTCIPVNGEGELSTEISTVHLSYLQRGGKDPRILAELQDLLSEAIKLEKMQPGKQPCPRTYDRPRHNKNDFSRELIPTQLENQRLEEELIRLQLRKRGHTFSRTAPNNHPSEQEMRTVQMDIDLLKREIEINCLRRQIRGRKNEPSLTSFPPLEEPRSQTPPLINNPTDTSDGLGPSSYDPMAGFVVFYDFLMGLCPSYRVCRLMVGVYSGDQALGDPAVLPPVYCEPFSFSTLPPQYGLAQKAILASKQSVPGFQPAESISLVMQLQASGGYDINGKEVTRLAPRGWVKLDLFDQHNCVISGRWKVPVRILPVKPSMTIAEINAVPQLDNAELYLRIVHLRDSETQSYIPISIHNAAIYKYPPVTTPKRPQYHSRQYWYETIHPPNVPSAQGHEPDFRQSQEQQSA